jgi:manganese/zinc/iron transport system substrate-binding protein
MVADIVREVVGPRGEVANLIGEGVDPHLHTPTRSDLVALTGADIVFYSGLLLEGRMEDAFKGLRRSGKPVFAVTELIPPEYLLAVAPGSEHHDPHVWMDPQGWSQAVTAVAQAMGKHDPEHATLYQERATAYQARLKELDDYARRAIASIPAEQRVLITAHDAFNYLGRAYQLEVLGIQGLSTESEAGLDDVNRLVDLLVKRQIGAIFVETSVADKNVRALVEGARARGHQVRIGGTLYSDAMGTKGSYEGTYIGMIDHNVTTIVRALGGEAPAAGWQGKLAGAAAPKGAQP